MISSSLRFLCVLCVSAVNDYRPAINRRDAENAEDRREESFDRFFF
jgi:hypothetical protein